MSSDTELLRRYVADHAEDAFTELVRRRLGLVYAWALPRVGHDAHLAEDIAQKVFCDLARKAASLTGHASLSSWLCVSTHVAAAEAVRKERRRKTRETEAHIMQTLLHDPVPNPEWSRLRPVLHEAIVQLREEDRAAIALRFFEQRSFAEVGAALRLTEEAARKRVDRALEKLHTGLARRGITSTTALVSAALGDVAATAAPVGLAAKVTLCALAQAAAVGTGSGLLTFLGSTLALSAALFVGTFAVVRQHRTNAHLEAELDGLRLAAPTLAAVRRENQQLARSLVDVEEQRRAVADLPTLRAALEPATSTSTAPAPTRATVTVQADGTLRWKSGLGSAGAEPINLADFTARLAALNQNAPGGEAKIGIRGFSEFSPLAYTIDQTRRTGIKHVVVESGATPDPKVGAWWFGGR
jgi:RNA polymerase sigma factor (sigma-70 family)